MSRTGGRYEQTKGGKIKQVEAPTQDHPDGNAPRDAQGVRVDRAPSSEPGSNAQTQSPTQDPVPASAPIAANK
ncbi:hypothetical protein [Magnetovibrio sp.]|uniref:hypothetical protein n=1 Tax=Magnetovibrio sp. TaxID=2024836 RepID=UPI002F92ED95